MAKDEKISFFTDVVTFIYPKLNTPDIYTPARGKPGKPKYKTDFDYPTPARNEKLKASLIAAAKKLMPDVDDPKMPYKEKDGAIVFSCSTGVPEKKYNPKTGKKEETGEILRPAIFDAKNQSVPVDVMIGGGTKGRLKLSLGLFPNGDGLVMYLDQVQIHDLVVGGAGVSAFDQADGFSYKGADGSDFDQSSGSNESGGSTDDDDDIAF